MRIWGADGFSRYVDSIPQRATPWAYVDFSESGRAGHAASEDRLVDE